MTKLEIVVKNPGRIAGAYQTLVDQGYVEAGSIRMTDKGRALIAELEAANARHYSADTGRLS